MPTHKTSRSPQLWQLLSSSFIFLRFLVDIYSCNVISCFPSLCRYVHLVAIPFLHPDTKEKTTPHNGQTRRKSFPLQCLTDVVVSRWEMIHRNSCHSYIFRPLVFFFYSTAEIVSRNKKKKRYSFLDLFSRKTPITRSGDWGNVFFLTSRNVQSETIIRNGAIKNSTEDYRATVIT